MSKEKFKELMRDAASGTPPVTAQERTDARKELAGLMQGLGEVGAELKRQADHGSAEVMQAIFTGNAFVPYGWGQTEPGQTTQENQGHGLHGDAKQSELERGGRE